MAWHQHFLMFARYNAWANGRLYDAVARLDDAAYRADRGAFFGSIHATLNHILVGDRLWLRRITGAGDEPASLDAILCDTLPALRAAREAEDARLLATVEGLDEAAFMAPLDYTNIAGDVFSQPLRQVLAHVFNHQTHHRGQVHDLLSQAGQAPPELDLIYYLRHAGAAG